jgi:hypothetical protein
MEEEELNDNCGSAMQIEARSDTYFGSNMNAELGDALGCENRPEGTSGLWYTLVGTGGEVTISTCSEQTDFDTEISIFSGSCSNLSCVEKASDGCGRQAAVSFPTTTGQEYFIRVRGETSTDVGNFLMTISVRSPFFGW